VQQQRRVPRQELKQRAPRQQAAPRERADAGQRAAGDGLVRRVRRLREEGQQLLLRGGRAEEEADGDERPQEGAAQLPVALAERALVQPREHERAQLRAGEAGRRGAHVLRERGARRVEDGRGRRVLQEREEQRQQRRLGQVAPEEGAQRGGAAAAHAQQRAPHQARVQHERQRAQRVGEAQHGRARHGALLRVEGARAGRA
jgi:hypothetical protein